ncbi:hypothetical protein MSAN_02048900 [Mycena sanguinolenta]|uniref:Uncharacterized protein n=1 Tax=Mycena sanguinolenta TaxID=230812 RepID=A0A8H6XK77_9AGAR|nr:hypothetical protein MSAN_02048900 [Mycena sanguinolenta]
MDTTLAADHRPPEQSQKDHIFGPSDTESEAGVDDRRLPRQLNLPGEVQKIDGVQVADAEDGEEVCFGHPCIAEIPDSESLKGWQDSGCD